MAYILYYSPTRWLLTADILKYCPGSLYFVTPSRGSGENWHETYVCRVNVRILSSRKYFDIVFEFLTLPAKFARKLNNLPRRDLQIYDRIRSLKSTCVMFDRFRIFRTRKRRILDISLLDWSIDNVFIHPVVRIMMLLINTFSLVSFLNTLSLGYVECTRKYLCNLMVKGVRYIVR